MMLSFQNDGLPICTKFPGAWAATGIYWIAVASVEANDICRVRASKQLNLIFCTDRKVLSCKWNT